MMALRATVASPRSGSSSGSSTEPKTTYLMSRVGMKRDREGSPREKTGKPSDVIVRASDVPTYVRYGAADLGIAGKDIL